MQYTNRLGLKKPELSDFVDIEDLNFNTDILDEVVLNQTFIEKIKNNVITTEDGFALDAKIGKLLWDSIKPVSGHFTHAGLTLKEINLGFRPRFVIVTTDRYHTGSVFKVMMAIDGQSVSGVSSSTILTISSSGFKYSTDINSESYQYPFRYYAWR